MRPKYVRKWQSFYCKYAHTLGQGSPVFRYGAREVALALSGEVLQSTSRRGLKKSHRLLPAADVYALVLEGGGQWVG